MNETYTHHLAHELILVRDLCDRSETRQHHSRAASAGTETRIARGAYLPRARWEGLSARERHAVRMLAYSRTRRSRPVFSHWSAAVWHGLPLIGPLPNALHVVVGRTSGGRSTRGVVAHSTIVHDEDIIELDGIRLTSLMRTIVDLAASAPTSTAVAAADFALASRGHAISEIDLLAAWERALPFRGHRRALDVVEFADGRAGSPLESVSRVTMRAIGCPKPELQVPFRDGDGFVGFTDFYWPDHDTIGEADGDLKYLDSEFRGGRSAEEVVLDEKVREDRLRALTRRFVRWRWKTAGDRKALSAALVAAGLPLGHRW